MIKEWIKRLAFEIPNDTLKKEINGVREWDRMKLTMFTAWIFVIVSASLYFIITGFHFEVWFTFVGVAMGSKIVDAQAKKLEK